MRKKLAALFVICSLVLSLCFNALGADEKVEIKFSVGESILSINGEKVEVTTPYVVNGATLVPVRVITEAFGAEVIWNGDDKSVLVNYSDVVIRLKIGDKTAYVNDIAVQLLAAPELSNSTTMLPLRFITENFGADVSYDDATGGITVIKQKTESNSIKDYSLILKRSDKELVGDSYHGWSMEHSPELTLKYRSFDGSENLFINSDETGVITVSTIQFEDETIDEIYAKMRESSKEYAVSKFEKSKTPEGIDYAVVHYSADGEFYEDRVYIKEKQGFAVLIAAEGEKAKEKFNTLSEITNTFDMKFYPEKTEDLSDVNAETGMHTYKSDYFGIEIDVPAYLYLNEETGKANSADFISTDPENSINLISLNIYSAYEGHNAKSWAESDRKNNMAALNEDFSSFTQLKERLVDGKQTYYYEQETVQKERIVMCDLFVEAGDYFYNISISGKKENFDEHKRDIITSVKFKDIDGEELGKLIRTDDYGNISYKQYNMDSIKMSFEVPLNWSVLADSPTGMAFVDGEFMRSLVISYYNFSAVENVSFANFAEAVFKKVNADYTTKMLDKSARIVKIGGKNVYSFKYMNDTEETDFFNSVYIIKAKDKYIVFSAGAPKYVYGKQTEEIFDYIIRSVNVN